MACLSLWVLLGGGYPEPGYAQLPPETVASGDESVLTLDDAVRRAIGWHPSIDQAVGSLNEKGEEVKSARAGYYPSISGGVGPSLTVSGGSRWRPRTTLTGSQMLYDFGKVSSSVAEARAGVQVSRAMLLLAVDNLARNTAYAVIEVQRNRALLDVAKAQLESLKAINKLVQYRVLRGASTRSDAVQSEARLESAQSTILQITAELRRWESNLRHLVGSDDPVGVTADVPVWHDRACRVPVPDWNNVPTIMQYEAQREQAMAQYKGARAAMMPSLALGVDVDADASRPFGRRSETVVGFTVSRSLYQGGATKARRNAAWYALKTAEASLAATRVEVSRTLAESQEQIDSLTSMIDTLRLRQEMMRETGKLYRLQYFDLGTRTLLDLLNAEQELHQARFDQVNAVHDVRRLDTDCLYATGATRDSYALSGMVVRGVTL